MEKEPEKNTADISLASIVGHLINYASTAQKIYYKASENNEAALVLSTWLLRYKLWELEHKEKEGVQVNNTINVNVTITKSGVHVNETPVKGDQEDILPPHVKDLISKIGTTTQTIPIYQYDPQNRNYFRRIGEGLETANAGRLLSLIDGVNAYVGISKRTDNDLEYTPLVRYFEVAGSVADANQIADYAYERVHKTKVGEFIDDTIPEEVQYASKRIATGVTGITLATLKNNLDPEETLTYRALEAGAHFGQAYLSTKNTFVNDALKSVEEAAQRQPYGTWVLRNIGFDSQKKDESGVLNALTATGVNASVRFAGKQAVRILENTEKGKEAKEWVNENIPEIGQDLGKEVLAAAITLGAITVGKPSCTLL